MDPRPALIERLKQHPELTYREASGSVRIDPPSSEGFAVELRSDQRGWTVFVGNAGFHEAFTSAEEALDFIAWCFSGAARLREAWRGGVPEKVVLEALVDGKWDFVSETGFFLVPFWRRRREVLLTNPNLLKD